MLKKSIKIFAVVFLVIFAVNLIRCYSSKSNTALIKIYGIINNSKTQSWINEIKEAAENNTYKAILIKINSPGGSANASERLYMAIKKADKIKPTVALIEGVGASGAYYAACGAEKIVAYPTSVVGSIGVLLESLNLSVLSNKIGVSSFIIKSGRLKDAGNPLRKPTKEDIQMLQNVVNGIYAEFLYDVASNRHIKENVLRKYADGSVFSSRSALKIGLIDSVGSEETAKGILKKEAHLKSVNCNEIQEGKNFIKDIVGSSFLFFLDYIELEFTPTAKTIFYD